MKRAFTLICLFVTLIMNVYAQDIRKYRVPVYNTIEEYQQNLIGKTFFYIPPIKDGKVVDVNSMGTKSYPVTITSIRGKKKRTKADEMRWKLTSEYSDEHELVIYIGHEDTWWSDEFENTDVPLYDMERYKQDFEKNVKQKLVGQKISHSGSNVSYTVTDVRIGNVDASGHSARNTYVLKNDSTGEIKEIVANDFESIKAIGEVISHQNSDTSYSVINIKIGNVDSLGHPSMNTYVLKNDSTGETKEITSYNFESIKVLGEVISHSNISYTVIDIKIGNVATPNHSAMNTYVLKNKQTGETKEIIANNFESIKYIGENISHPNSKTSFTIVSIKAEKEKYTYELKNNTTGHTFKIIANDIKEVKTELYKNLFDGRYEASLKKVEKPTNPNLKYGKMTTIGKNTDGFTEYSYTDTQIDIIIVADREQFNFSLKNVSDKTQRLIWNDAVFVDMDGTTSKVVHIGASISQVEQNQAASVIIKGAKIDDIARPVKKYILPSKYHGFLLPTIKLMLPIQIKDIINEYTFEFKVTWVYTNPDYKPVTK